VGTLKILLKRYVLGIVGHRKKPRLGKKTKKKERIRYLYRDVEILK